MQNKNGMDGRDIFNYRSHVKNISKQTRICHQTTQECQDKTIDSVLDFLLGFMNKSTGLEYRWINKVFNTNFRRSTGEAKKLTYAASVIGSSLVFISCLFEPAGWDAVNLSDIIPLKCEAWIPTPSNHQATVGSIFVCQRIGLIYRFCQSSPLYLPQTEKQVATTWPGQHQICRLKVWTTEAKLTVNLRHKNVFCGYSVLPVIPKHIKIQLTIQTWNVMKAQKTFAYQKFAVHSRQRTPMSPRCGVRAEHIKLRKLKL